MPLTAYFGLLLRRVEALEELLQVGALVLQELELLLALPLVDRAPLRLPPLDRFALVLQLDHAGLLEPWFFGVARRCFQGIRIDEKRRTPTPILRDEDTDS